MGNFFNLTRNLQSDLHYRLQTYWAVHAARNELLKVEPARLSPAVAQVIIMNNSSYAGLREEKENHIWFENRQSSRFLHAQTKKAASWRQRSWWRIMRVPFYKHAGIHRMTAVANKIAVISHMLQTPVPLKRSHSAKKNDAALSSLKRESDLNSRSNTHK